MPERDGYAMYPTVAMEIRKVKLGFSFQRELSRGQVCYFDDIACRGPTWHAPPSFAYQHLCYLFGFDFRFRNHDPPSGPASERFLAALPHSPLRHDNPFAIRLLGSVSFGLSTGDSDRLQCRNVLRSGHEKRACFAVVGDKARSLTPMQSVPPFA